MSTHSYGTMLFSQPPDARKDVQCSTSYDPTFPDYPTHVDYLATRAATTQIHRRFTGARFPLKRTNGRTDKHASRHVARTLVRWCLVASRRDWTDSRC